MKNILLIEDDSLYASTVKMLLDECGDFNIIHATTLKEGLDSLIKYCFDFIICDLGLPDSDGAQTTIELRKHTKLPIIILSGIDFASIITASMLSNAADYILKSEISIERLLKSIEYIKSYNYQLK